MFRTSGSYSHECMRDASVHERMGSIVHRVVEAVGDASRRAFFGRGRRRVAVAWWTKRRWIRRRCT